MKKDKTGETISQSYRELHVKMTRDFWDSLRPSSVCLCANFSVKLLSAVVTMIKTYEVGENEEKQNLGKYLNFQWGAHC